MGIVGVATAAGGASGTHVHAKVNLTVVTGGGKDRSDGISDSKDINDGNKDIIISDNSNTGKDILAGDVTPISIDPNVTSDVQKVVLTPGKKFLISVDPCAGSTPPSNTNNSPGIPLEALKVADSKDFAAKVPIIPQTIVPATTPLLKTSEDDDIQRLVDQQPILANLTVENLNEQVNRFIEFVDLSREAALNKLIKWPRLVFIGESDEIKYGVIENLIGLPGILTPPSGSVKINPRFPAPLRFTLKNDPSAQELTIKIDSVPVATPEGLFAALQDHKIIKEASEKFTISQIPIEIEFIGSTVPSLIFIDLPWTLPAQTQTTENDQILAKLFEKYLRQTWNFTVALGSEAEPFEQWKILKLARTFDENMKRIFVTSVNKNDAPENDQQILGLILGLQDSLPILKKGKMFYLDNNSNALVNRIFCSNVKCGKDQFIRSLQTELLRHWYANRPEALKIIKSIYDPLSIKISGYDGYWAITDPGQKLKVLINQARPVLHESLIFFPEDRDNSPCTGSSLDLIKDSIFENNPSNPTKSYIESKSITWQSIFSAYQNEISRLPRVPGSVDWTGVKSLIYDLKVQGPTREIISTLKRLVLKPQLDSLALPKSHLLEIVKMQWIDKVSQALEHKFSLEAFLNFKAEILKAAETVFTSQFGNLKFVNDETDFADEISGWFFNFPSAENSSFWLNLMKSESVESALTIFRETVQFGFVEICNRNSVLLPRLIIKNLLTRHVVKQILKIVESKTTEKENLVEMSSESIEALKKLQKLLNLYQKLLEERK